MKVIIYTDGSARSNPGRGGYGAVLKYTNPAGKTFTSELSRGYAKTTNNRMELMAVIVALEALNRPCEVEVHSDSQYVVNAFNKHWIDGWKKRGWKTANKQPVKNRDLWERLLTAKSKHKVEFIWVKGHAGHELNERCDELATTAADGSNLDIDTGFNESDLLYPHALHSSCRPNNARGTYAAHRDHRHIHDHRRLYPSRQRQRPSRVCGHAFTRRQSRYCLYRRARW